MKSKDLKNQAQPQMTVNVANTYGRLVGLIASRCITITPSNTEDIKDSDGDLQIGILALNNKTGIAGDISFIPADEPDDTKWVTWSYAVGDRFEMLVRRVGVTGTTATGIELWVL